MSNKDTGFIKILFVVLIMGVSHQFSGCVKNTSQMYSDSDEGSQILNGSEVLDSNPLAQKVLYLATGAQLLKTPNGGYSATQTGFCTATAISPKFILTAAHCLRGDTPNEHQTPDTVYIILGRKPWKSEFNPALWQATEKIFIHPSYQKTSDGGVVNDIALLQLKTALPTEYVSELARASDLSSNLELTLAGYGLRTNIANLGDAETEKNTSELFSVSKIITDYDINQLTLRIDQRDEKGICNGDSGGPALIVDTQSKKIMTIGVLSGYNWNIIEKKQIDPENKLACFGFAVYANIMNPLYYDWIQKTIHPIQ